jgi:hypothetical protein
MNGLNDFVAGGYPLPWNPVTMGEFVPGSYPLPWNPVFFASSGGSLPKSPPLPMALIGAKNGKAAAAASDGCGMGCGCDSCGGMGDIAVPTWAPSFLNGAVTLPVVGSVPTVYLALAIGIGAVMFMGGSSRRRR